MAEVEIERVLQTCIGRHAQEILFLPGKPPILRIEGSIREMQTKELTSEDVARLVLALGPAEIGDHYRSTGFCTFDYTYPHEDDTVFHALLIRHGPASTAIITPMTNNPDTN